MTLPQASWLEQRRLPRGSVQGLAFPCLPAFPSLLDPEKAAPAIRQAQAYVPSSLISVWVILSDQALHASNGVGGGGRRPGTRPITTKVHRSPGPPRKPSPGPPWGRTRALWESSLSQTLLCSEPAIHPWRRPVSFCDCAAVAPTQPSVAAGGAVHQEMWVQTGQGCVCPCAAYVCACAHVCASRWTNAA